MKIDEEMKEKMYEEANHMTESLTSIISEIKELNNSFTKFCNDNNIHSYFAITTGYKLSDSLLDLNDSIALLEAFKKEIDQLNSK